MSSLNIFRMSEESESASSAPSEEKAVPEVKRKVGRPRFEAGVIQTSKPDYW